MSSKKNNDGTFQSFIRDITERIISENALKESEKNFRILFENSPLGTSIATPDGTIIDANKALLKMLGSPSIEATKQINVLTFPALVKNGYAELFEKCIKDNEMLSLEIGYTSKWGTDNIYSSYLVPLSNVDGKVEKVYTIMEDITQRKMAEEALRESEGLFRNLAVSTATAIFVYQDDKFVFANEATEKLMGYSKEELFGMYFWDVVHPDNKQLVKERGIARQNGKNISSRYQIKLLRKDKTEAWIDFAGGIINWSGKKAGIGSAIDITELKITEEKLIQSEKRYKIITDSTSDYLFSAQVPVSGNSKMDWVGGSFEKITGYTFEEYQEIGSWSATLHPEDVNIDVAAFDELENNRKAEIEVRIFNKSGKIVWVRCSTSPVWSEEEQRVVTLYGSVKDITEEKNGELSIQKSEERYKLISNLTSDYLFSTTIDNYGQSIQSWVGGSFTEITGYTAEEYKRAGGWVGTLHPDHIEEDKKAFNKLANNKKAIVEVKTIHKSGKIVWVESFGSPVWDKKENKLIGINGAVRDITKEKEASIALKESEEKYKLISNITSDYLFESRFNKKNKLETIWVAGSFKKMTGYTLDEYQKVGGWSKLLHKDDFEIDNAAFIELKQNRKAIVEVRTVHKDGKIIWVKNSCSPIWDNEKNKLLGVVGAAKDITAEKREQQVRQIQYNIANAVVNVKKTNELFSIVRNELLQLIDAKNFFVAFYNEDRDELTTSVDFDKEQVRSWDAKKSITGIVIETKKKFFVKKDEIISIAKKKNLVLNGDIPEVWLGVPLIISNKVIGAIVVQSYDNPNAYDKLSIDLISVIASQLSLFIERNKAQEDALRLSRAITQSPVSVVITTPDGNIEYVNPHFEKNSGYTFEEVFGENSRILKSGHHSEDHYKELWNTLLSGKDWHGEFLNKKKNGELYWENVSISPIENTNGKITHFVAIKEDFTEKKKMFAELITSKEKAEVSEKVKTEFLAQMSHEIRSPLNIIMNFIGLIKMELDDQLSQDMEGSFESIETASTRIIRTIDLILNSTDLQQGSYESVVTELDVVSTLNKIRNEYKHSAEKKGLELRINLEFNKKKIKSDEYAFIQIISNLVDNAIKYSIEGYIEINAAKDERSGVIIKVKDTVIGMSKEFIPNRFNSISQEEQGYTRSYDGNGLGMALVKKYCDIISVKISVESIKGEGSTFTLLVPNLKK
jgi:PAS domain S-box-containing protein